MYDKPFVTKTEAVGASGKRVRALVVDDSALMRKLVSEILTSGGIEVAGTARDGQEALEKVKSLAPDVLTLDIEMPKMNGVEFLKALMAEKPLPVVMLSSLTEAGAEITMQCLALGAVECLQKPSGSISVDIEKIGAEIVSKVLTASKARIQRWSAPVPRAVAGPSVRPAGSARAMLGSFPVVVIASSTGGPAALGQVVPLLPPDLHAAVVVVQHLPVGFTRSLSTRLDMLSGLSVREAVEGDHLQPGVALIAPAGRHLAFDSNGKIALNDEPSLWGVRPAADIMMRSASERFGSRVVGAVLTGMGRDGALGAKAVRQHGGWCVAQDEATCVVYGMPRAADEAGGIDQILPLANIAEAITARVNALCKRQAA
jgi:two-component system chemotaxis response regulator CheB